MADPATLRATGGATIPARPERRHILPPSLPPRGLSRVQAAEYIGVSPTLFDQMVADKRMPKPKRINSRTVWDVRQLDVAFAALPDDNDRDDPWGRVEV